MIIELILKNLINQIFFLLSILLILFFTFEIIPILIKKQNTIKKNFSDLLKYQLLRGLYTLFLGTFLAFLFFYTKINFGIFDITHLSIFSQVIIIYFCGELTIYTAHLIAHKYRVLVLSKAHSFHHTITTDMEWVNSRKEHYFVLSLFTFVFCLLFYVIFKSSTISHLVVIATYFALNAFSHYRLPISLPVLNQVFLFPGDHLKHHTERSGPYGVTLSLFDTIFNTRK